MTYGLIRELRVPADISPLTWLNKTEYRLPDIHHSFTVMIRIADGSERTNYSKTRVACSQIFCGGMIIAIMVTGIFLLINTSDVYGKSNCDVVPHGEPCIKSKAEFGCVDRLIYDAGTAGLFSVLPISNVLIVFWLFTLPSAYHGVKHTQITVFKDSESKTIDMTCEAFIKLHVPDLLLACEMSIFLSWLMLAWWILLFGYFVYTANKSVERA